jgi:hypothetical protein
MPSMVKALRLCDSFEPAVAIAHEPLQIENVKVEDAREPITVICEWLFNNNYKWEDMQDFIKLSYITYVIDKFHTKKEAADFLGVGATYLCKLSRKENT